MIEINLLPGARRNARRAGPSFDLTGSLASVRERIRQPWLIGSVAVAVIALAAIGLLYVQQTRRETKINEALEKAVQDSTRFASVLREREKAEARRDTVLRALNLIRAIDDDRFIWPHIMDEVNHALPPYTWLVSLGYSGLGQAQTAIQTLAPAAASDSGSKKKRKPLGTVVMRDTIRLRVLGNTVDIQALTRFLKHVSAWMSTVLTTTRSR